MHCVVIGEYFTLYLRTVSGQKKSSNITKAWKPVICTKKKFSFQHRYGPT